MTQRKKTIVSSIPVGFSIFLNFLRPRGLPDGVVRPLWSNNNYLLLFVSSVEYMYKIRMNLEKEGRLCEKCVYWNLRILKQSRKPYDEARARKQVGVNTPNEKIKVNNKAQR